MDYTDEGGRDGGERKTERGKGKEGERERGKGEVGRNVKVFAVHKPKKVSVIAPDRYTKIMQELNA